LVKGNSSGFKNSEVMGVVVTERYLREVGLDIDSSIFMPLKFDQNGTDFGDLATIIPIPIVAVVKEIPGKFDLGFNNVFSAALRDNNGMFSPFSYNSLTYYFTEKPKSTKSLKKLLEEFQSKNQDIEFIISPIKTYDLSYKGGHYLKLQFLDSKKYDLIEEINKDISRLLREYGLKPVRIYDFNESHNKSLDNVKANYLSINFERLEDIESFAKYLNNLNVTKDKDISLEVDTSNVKEKRNFNFLSKILYLISILLISFSIVCICLFVANLLRMHIEKVKMNIGTFMAFGLNNLRVQAIYFQITSIFILLSIFLGFTLSIAIGYFINGYMKSLIVEKGVIFFYIYTFNTLLITLFIFFISVFLAYIIIRKMLSKTPGDLIYNR
jgi:ABC-type antimicrobial peptide transport system permease subunit